MKPIHLLLAADDHFAWLLDKAPAPAGLRQPEGGFDQEAVISLLRRVTATLHAAGCFASWLMVDQDQLVGSCCFVRPPDPAGVAEIGYGVAASCRRRGYATSAVGLLVDEVAQTRAASRLEAGTAIHNLGSQRVLERNGFTRAGARHDPDDGELILWTREVPG